MHLAIWLLLAKILLVEPQDATESISKFSNVTNRTKKVSVCFLKRTVICLLLFRECVLLFERKQLNQADSTWESLSRIYDPPSLLLMQSIDVAAHLIIVSCLPQNEPHKKM